MQRSVYLQLTPLAEATALWLEAFALSPLRQEETPLREAHGRTLAVPAVAALSSPAFHGAAMDGIAVAAPDTYGASEYTPKSLTIGENAHWINTGHPLPQGTNAVIMVENVFHEPRIGSSDVISIEKAAFPWQHVRKLGEDMVATEILLPQGTVIGPYELGALAAAGIVRPVVYAKPKVLIIPSGSELVPVDQASPEELSRGTVLPEFNSLVLAALVRQAGGEALVHSIVPDEPDELRKALREAAASDADMIIINAGSSAGSHDYTARIIKEAGEVWVHGVGVMPGKPTILGCVAGKAVLGVPGYPVSAIISFEEFGQSLLAVWQQRTRDSVMERRTVAAYPFQAIPSRPGMEERIRVRLGAVDETLVAVPLPRGAGTVTSLSRADGIITIPAGVEGLPDSAAVPVTLIKSQQHIAGAVLAIGSHDNSLDMLDSFMRKKNPYYSLTSAHVGSVGGLNALARGRCHIAGCHLLDPATGTYNQQALSLYMKGVPARRVHLVNREQGLMLPPGNPLGITGLGDLTRPELSFINRQRGSGTRVLFDWQLSQLGIAPDAINGYRTEEYTHMNVAAAVLSGRASAGLGVRAAAIALGLEFIPVGVEEYDLVIPERFWDDPRIQTLLETIRSDEFISAVQCMGGYDTTHTGQPAESFPG